MVFGIAIGYASADFHRRRGLGVQTVIREWMRNDAKRTCLLIGGVCVAALAAYLIEHMFGVDLGVSDRDALAAGLVATFGGLVYLLHSAVLNALGRAKRYFASIIATSMSANGNREPMRQEERRVGNECDSTCGSRGSPDNKKK